MLDIIYKAANYFTLGESNNRFCSFMIVMTVRKETFFAVHFNFIGVVFCQENRFKDPRPKATHVREPDSM